MARYVSFDTHTGVDIHWGGIDILEIHAVGVVIHGVVVSTGVTQGVVWVVELELQRGVYVGEVGHTQEPTESESGAP